MCVVACLQMNSNHLVDENLETVKQLLVECSGKFDILLLPENFAHMPRNEKERLHHAEVFLNGKIQSFLQKIARQYDCWVIAGSIAILPDTANIDEDSKGKIFQSCLVFDNVGELKKRYDKTHLFDVTLGNGEQYHESQYIAYGDRGQNPVVATPWGIIGLSICYDLRFPEFYRNMPIETFLICVPAAFTHNSGEAHWETLLKARAIENQVYIAAAAQTGLHSNKRSTWGHSMLIDPWGEITNSLSSQEGVVSAEINFEYIQQLGQQFPCLEHK